MKKEFLFILILLLACSKDSPVPDEPETLTFLLSVSSSEGGAVDVSSLTNMRNVFGGATNFNQDLFSWCVSNFQSEPEEFSGGSALTDVNKPVWGTCPND